MWHLSRFRVDGGDAVFVLHHGVPDEMDDLLADESLLAAYVVEEQSVVSVRRDETVCRDPPVEARIENLTLERPLSVQALMVGYITRVNARTSCEKSLAER